MWSEKHIFHYVTRWSETDVPIILSIAEIRNPDKALVIVKKDYHAPQIFLTVLAHMTKWEVLLWIKKRLHKTLPKKS